jgi:hypothetical protein
VTVVATAYLLPVSIRRVERDRHGGQRDEAPGGPRPGRRLGRGRHRLAGVLARPDRPAACHAARDELLAFAAYHREIGRQILS